MSTKIGGAWENVSENTGKTYISAKINDELLPITINKGVYLNLYLNEVTEETSEKAPQYSVVLSVPKE